jgi:hypothetical protein
VARDDRLIAFHLALDMVRDCCVLLMMLRDRAEGTNHHREGGIGNRLAAELGSVVQPPTAAGILAMIEVSSILFDELAARWSDIYTGHRQPLLARIRYARKELG